MTARLAALAAITWLTALMDAGPARAQKAPPAIEPDPGLAPAPPAYPDGPPPPTASPPPAPYPYAPTPPYPYPYPYPPPNYPPPGAAYPPYPPPTATFEDGGRPAAITVPRRSSLLVSIELGPAAHYAYHESLYAGRLSLLIGAQDSRFGGGVLVEGDFGKTSPGLQSEAFNVGPAFRFPLTRWLGVGFGVASTFVIVHRVTNNEVLSDFRWGPWLQLTADLARGEAGALFLGLRGGVDYSFGDNSAGFSGALTLGFRSAAPAR